MIAPVLFKVVLEHFSKNHFFKNSFSPITIGELGAAAEPPPKSNFFKTSVSPNYYRRAWSGGGAAANILYKILYNVNILTAGQAPLKALI